MSVTVSVLASGSRANAILISEGKTRILFDAGLGIRNMTAALAFADCRFDQLSAIFLTHEHTDHVRGLAKLLDKTRVPLYASAGTLAAVDYMVPARVRLTAMNGEVEEVGSFAVRAIPISHDAREPLSYHMQAGGHGITVATDLGEVPLDLMDALMQSTCAVLESNHDEEMLANGPYPAILKQRIRSDRGHLSNRQTAAALHECRDSALRSVVLAHISDENNDPALARAASEDALAGTEIGLHLTSRMQSGPILHLDEAQPVKQGTFF